MATSFTTWLSPVTPTITSPTASQTGVGRNPTITSSAFSSPDSLTHTSSTWQIATDSGFSSVVWSKSADTTNKVSIVVNTTNGTFAGALSGLTKLAVGTNYYVRVKYTDSESTDSAYSAGILFTTISLTITDNAAWVEENFGEYPVKVAKKSQVSTVDGIPTDSASDGTLRVDTDNSDLYFRVNGEWKKVIDTDSDVSSVFGRTGDVVAATNDYTWAQINKTTSSIADITTKSHTALTDIGTNTHTQIDSHISGTGTSVHGDSYVLNTGDTITGQLVSTLATGTSPLSVTSTTVVSNLNTDMVDGKHTGTSGNTIPLLDGNNTFSGTTTHTGSMIVKSVTDAGPMTATNGTVGEIVFNTSDTSFYGCTVTGTPATWTKLG